MELLLYHYPILGPGLETHTGVFGSEIQDDPHFQYQVGPIHLFIMLKTCAIIHYLLAAVHQLLP
jgi:hypothetical protein